MLSAQFSHPNPKFQEILDSITTYSCIYSACLNDLHACEDKLNFTQTRFALEVILGMAWLEKNAQEVAKIEDEQKRNTFITEKISLVAEPGVIPGNSRDDVLNSLAARIDEFKQAYLFDKERGCEAAFFAYAFVGPPCLNGRLITLQEYIVGQQQRGSTYAFERKWDCDQEACELENVIYAYQKSKNTSNLPKIEDLRSYLIAAGDPLVKHPKFSEIFRRAMEFAAMNQ